jgi:hypothetical protein
VRNIYKYYVTYQGLEQTRQSREKALENHAQESAASGQPWIAAVLVLALLGLLGVAWQRFSKPSRSA